GIAVSVVDPLGMVVTVATVERGVVKGKQGVLEAGFGPAVTGAALHPLVLEDIGDEVVALDENGNFLRVVALPPREVVSIETPAAPSTPILKRWITWAIPAGVFTGASVFFFIDAQRSRDRLDDILANPSMHYFDEAEVERRR